MSRPIRRVLCRFPKEPVVTIYLGHTLPCGSSNLPAGVERAARLLRGLAPNGVYLAASVTESAGGLLHHPFTLTCCQAVYFLLHFPAGRPGWALPTVLPCGARTFLDICRGHLAGSSVIILPLGWAA